MRADDVLHATERDRQGVMAPLRRFSSWIFRRETLLFTILPSVALGIYFSFLAIPLLRMFLLIEYRQWVFLPSAQKLTSYFDLSHMLSISGTSASFQLAASRDLSYWVAFLFGAVCGPAPVCHNVWHLLIILTATTLSVLTMRKLSVSGSPLPLLVIGSVILISMPVWDALSWQATLLDKLAMLFTATALLIAASLDVERPTWPRLVLSNAALFAVAFAEYNSKEAGFFLAPAVTLLILCRLLYGGMRPVRAVSQALTFSALPLAYALFHVGFVYYNRSVINPTEYARVTGGDLRTNLELYARYILNLHGTNVSTRTIAITVAGLSFIVLIGTWLSRRHFPVPLTLWAAVSLIATLVIPLRTSDPAPFYLLVAMVYFGLLLGLTVDAILATQRPGLGRAVILMACLAFLALRAETIRDVASWYDAQVQRSDNFQETLRRVRDAVRGDVPSRIIFIRTQPDDVAYMLMAAPGKVDHALSPYLADATATPATLLRMDQAVFDAASPAEQPPPKPGDLQVFVGPLLKFDHMNRVAK